jgi:hypothetical protein
VKKCRDRLEQRALGDVQAEQLRQLVDDDDQPDARFEAGQNGLRDELRDEPEPEE